MPHEAQFSDSVLQAPVRVLGLVLRPFSIGHSLLLTHQRNALVILSTPQFAVFSEDSQKAAIRHAALVCSRSWNKQKRNLLWVRWWVRLVRNVDHFEAVGTFTRYRIAGSQSPPGPSDHARKVIDGEDDKAGRQHGSPFISRVLNFVMRLPDREIKVHGDSAYDFPLGLAQFLYISHLEENGMARVENSEEHRIESEWREMTADIAPEKRFN